MVADVTDVDAVARAMALVRPECVVHAAAYGVNYADQDRERAFTVNVQATLTVLDHAARQGVRRMIHVGSCFEYGDRGPPIPEDAPLRPTALYGATKAAASLLVRQWADNLGMQTVIARPFAIWGPWEAAQRVVPQVLAACRTGRPVALTACDVVRDYTYVEDMADWLIDLAVAEPCPPSIVNLGSGQAVVLRDFLRAIARRYDAESLLRFGTLPHRPTEMRCLVPDISRQIALFGHPAARSLDGDLRRMEETLALEEATGNQSNR